MFIPLSHGGILHRRASFRALRSAGAVVASAPKCARGDDVHHICISYIYIAYTFVYLFICLFFNTCVHMYIYIRCIYIYIYTLHAFVYCVRVFVCMFKSLPLTKTMGKTPQFKNSAFVLGLLGRENWLKSIGGFITFETFSALRSFTDGHIGVSPKQNHSPN